MRRTAMISCLAMAVATSACVTAPGATLMTESAASQHSLDSPQPVVTTENGAVRGIAADGVTSFKGIPFAAPPVGDLRWRAPQPAGNWDGVRPGDAYGPDCMQNYVANPLPPGSTPSEDCLYANVWRPSGDKKDLPVLVWIYGGGFVNGSSSRLIYTGSRLALQDIVVVSFNYRLGRFGTFAHPALTAADADEGKLLNYGFMDQIAAMNWVQRNIAAFGGDASRVTIMGESAGGMSVHNLMTSPMTQGKDLFQGAIIASGGNGAPIQANTLESAEAIGVAFAESAGVESGSASALADLRAIPADTLRGDIKLGAVLSGGPRTFSSPFPDGTVSVNLQEAYNAGKFEKVPVMIGATSGDLGGRDGSMVKGARDLAATFSNQNVPTWYYRFSYIADAAEAPREDGAIHADDLPYYFDTADIKYGQATTPADQQMGHTISTYVANFVKSGTPNGPTVPAWTRYEPSGPKMMDFSLSGEAVDAPDPWAPTN